MIWYRYKFPVWHSDLCYLLTCISQMVVSMSLKQWTTLRNRDHCVTDYNNKKLDSTAAATWLTAASPHWEVSHQEVLTYTAHTPSDAIYASRWLHISCSTFINQLKKSKSWRNSDMKLTIWKVHAWLSGLPVMSWLYFCCVLPLMLLAIL